jgi:ribosome-interacting GTPase 1
MPANLPPEYFQAEAVYRQASTPAEKIEALQAMLSATPKHKGTDHLRADLRARIARLSQEAARRGGPTTTQLYSVRKEGAGQVALLGPPNVGKSQLLASLTDASPKVAPYPFTTQLPQPAMMRYENVRVQIVDLPPIAEHNTHAWMRPIIRQADLLLLVVDLSDDPLTDLESSLGELASIRVEPASGNEPEQEGGLIVRSRVLVVANKLDASGAGEVYDLLLEEIGGRWPAMAVSAAQGDGLEQLRRLIYERLEVVRVHTKAPGREVDLSKPVVLRAGSTVEDLAEALHLSFSGRIRYAKVWGSGKFQGQRVSRAYTPEDGDVVELYA